MKNACNLITGSTKKFNQVYQKAWVFKGLLICASFGATSHSQYSCKMRRKQIKWKTNIWNPSVDIWKPKIHFLFLILLRNKPRATKSLPKYYCSKFTRNCIHTSLCKKINFVQTKVMYVYIYIYYQYFEYLYIYILWV